MHPHARQWPHVCITATSLALHLNSWSCSHGKWSLLDDGTITYHHSGSSLQRAFYIPVTHCIMVKWVFRCLYPNPNMSCSGRVTVLRAWHIVSGYLIHFYWSERTSFAQKLLLTLWKGLVTLAFIRRFRTTPSQGRPVFIVLVFFFHNNVDPKSTPAQWLKTSFMLLCVGWGFADAGFAHVSLAWNCGLGPGILRVSLICFGPVSSWHVLFTCMDSKGVGGNEPHG